MWGFVFKYLHFYRPIIILCSKQYAHKWTGKVIERNQWMIGVSIEIEQNYYCNRFALNNCNILPVSNTNNELRGALHISIFLAP
jgi:hypothetical protein